MKNLLNWFSRPKIEIELLYKGKDLGPLLYKGTQRASGYDIKALSIKKVLKSNGALVGIDKVDTFNEYFKEGTPFMVNPQNRILIGTGIKINLPKGYEAEIRSRSSLPLNSGLIVANGVGTMDNDYLGEYMVSLINTSSTPVKIVRGQRIAQILFKKSLKIEINYVEETTRKTKRGTGGFGSTGV